MHRSFGERFDVESLVGSGGAGVIYRARDRETGQSVAVKVLAGVGEPERFEREATLLAQIRHPRIVRYVAHGTSSTGEAYLAMEWLDGEDLASRLERGELTLPETLLVVRHAAEALAAVHARGVVHRDVKPRNLFLRDGALERLTLIDFGIASVQLGAAPITRTGAILGTPGYLSPEQAYGERLIDARADVFALGCVIFRCLTGRKPFEGRDLIGVLMKTVLEEAPRVRDLRGDAPKALDDLVAAMLSKDPSARPRDAREASERLAALGEVRDAPSPEPTTAVAVTAKERRGRCIVVAALGRPDDVPVSEAATLGTLEVRARDSALRKAVERHGARVDLLADRVIVATATAAGAATDQAVQAARCALALREELSGVPIAVVAARAGPSGDLEMGAVIDRAVGLLAEESSVDIRVDDVIAGLLDERFDVRGSETGMRLVAERSEVESARTLLGKPTECVGREVELQFLSAKLEECITESAAQVVLVTGAPGVGKSRLRSELLRATLARGEAIEVWTARCDPTRAGSPFGTIAPALRRLAGIADGEPRAVQHRKLGARVGRYLSGDDLTRVHESLGEMLGTLPEDEQRHGRRRSGRQDAVSKWDRIRRAWEDLLAAECDARPVLLVVEDLQWSDLPSVQLLDGALRNLRDRRLMVLALARPDVHEVFPGLWHERHVQELRLRELSKSASEKLVRQVLGPDVGLDVASRLVGRAAGNAFYLEELIRAVVEGRGAELPDTVLAMVETRIARLEGEARRVLRAASVLGQTFWRGGVSHLLGGDERTEEIDEWLEELVEREIVTSTAKSRFPSEREYAFRHALVREAAHAMLTDNDRTLAHRLAGEWLERAGERDPIVLAEHFERGRERARAVFWYRRAAEQSLSGNDCAAAIECVERAIACGAGGEVLGALHVLEAEAYGWLGHHERAEAAGLKAMRILPRGALWFDALGEVAPESGRLDHGAELVALADALCATDADDESVAARTIAAARAAVPLLDLGRVDASERLFALIDELEPRIGDDPIVAGRVSTARAHRAISMGKPSAFLDLCETAAAAWQRAGDLRRVCNARTNVAYSYLAMGAYEHAQAALEAAAQDAERMGLGIVVLAAKQNLGLVLARRGLVAEARDVETEALDLARAHGDQGSTGSCRSYLAEILALAGELDAAEVEARAAVALLESRPSSQAHALAVLAGVLLKRRCASDALEIARKATAILDELGALTEGESLVRLALVEALAANDRREDARVAALRSREWLLSRASEITRPELRETFLGRVPENARLLALAEQHTQL